MEIIRKVRLGIDPSLTGTGICAVTNTNELLLHKTFHTEKTGVERLVELRNKLQQIIYQFTDLEQQEMIVTVEGYAFGAKNHKAEALAEWGGVLRLTLYQDGLKYIEVPPTSVKKFITDNGNANKLKMALAIQRIYGLEFPNDNEFDAYAIAQVGRAIAGDMDLLNYQKEVIKKLGH